jgi:5'-nucleotidase/UDP-sugar diphosphatase
MKIFGKTRAIALLSAAAVAGALLLAACAGGARPVQREAGRAYELLLLHTNDTHGTVLPVNGRGGLAERAAFVSGARAANPNVLLLDAGDLNTGAAISNMFRAEPDILAYNMMGYAAMAVGNHDISYGRERFEMQNALANFPIFSSNIMDGRNFLGGRQYVVQDFEGFRVGIFTLTTLRSREIAGGGTFVGGLNFINEIEAARAAVDLLRRREAVDIVIALTHIGDVRESDSQVRSPELAAAVPGIDIIVDGHSHTLFSEPMRVGDTFIVSAGERGFFVGAAAITIVDGNIASFDWAPVEITGFAPDAAVAAMLAPFIASAEEALGEVVGQAASEFVFGDRLPRYQETAIGNMVSDGVAWYVRNVLNQSADFAFTNGGNIRAPLAAGDMTRGDIITVLPFENFIYVVSLSGAEIIEMFDFIATIPQGAGGFPQFSQEVRYTLNVPERRISNLTIGGAPVDPSRTYRFVTNDFLLSGGDGYEVLTRAREPFSTSMLKSEMVIEYIQSIGAPIVPATDGRMVVVGGVF